MITTRTGNFPVGFRRQSSSAWQKDVGGLLQWANKLGLSHVDLGGDSLPAAREFIAGGLKVGSLDLLNWRGLLSPDAGTRKPAVEANTALIRAGAALGIRNFLVVMIPEKPEAPRKENFGYMLDSLNALGPALDATGTHIVIEGCPAPGALCCTPETIRATLKACYSRNVGLNFDPSHLLRMHIDPLRFLEEFGDHVFHVHGKDAEILSENLYEYGSEQPPTFGKARQFGAITWRYTIPGHGCFRWRRGLEILASRNYQGVISVELEDEDFNGSEQGEQRGLTAGAHYLMTC